MPGGPRLQSLDGFDFGNVSPEVAFDPHFERNLTRRATDTSPMQADFDGALGREVEKLDIAPVGLDRRADQIDHLLDALTDLGGDLGRGAHRADCTPGALVEVAVRK